MKNFYRLILTSVALFLSLQLVYAQPSACPIKNLKAQADSCTSDSTYLLQIDLDYQFPSDSFNLFIDNEYYGSFQYQELPLEIHDAQGNGGPFDIIKVCHAGIPNCCKVSMVETPACVVSLSCDIEDLSLDVFDCQNDEFSVRIDFDVVSPSSSSFIVLINGSDYGLYDYSSLPVEIGPIQENGNDTKIEIVDADDPDCYEEGEIEYPACQGQICEIDDLELEAVGCDSDSFNLSLDFDHEFTGGNGFDLIVNGVHYGNYLYDELPVKFGSFHDSLDKIVVSVVDIELPNCTAMDVIDDYDCDTQDSTGCDFDEVEVTIGDCTSDVTYTLTVDLTYNTALDSFDLFANNNVYIGRYAYDDLPLTIDDFPSNGGPFDHVKICNAGPPNCCTVKKYSTPSCVGLVPHQQIIDFMSLYPNPGTDNMKIQKKEELEIYSAYLVKPDGKFVKLNIQDGEIDVSPYRPGHYFLIVESSLGSVTKQLIISD